MLSLSSRGKGVYDQPRYMTGLARNIFLVLLSTGCCGLELDVKVSVPVQGGGREYIYYTEKITWNEAATYCEDIGGKLAKVDSASFQDQLLNQFKAEYGSSPFSDDYWLGVFQPSQGNFRWASDCSKAYYTTNLNKDWDNSKKCFKFKKDDITGDRESCSSNNAFICEKPLSPGYSCSMSEIFSVNSLGTDSIDLSDCESSCDSDPDCWMVMFTPPFGCVKIAYNTATLASGVQAVNSPVRLKGKFCIEVTRNSGSVSPSTSDSSNNPAVDCSAPDPIPASVAAVPASSIAPTPCSTQFLTVTSTAICPTQTVTTTPVQVCTPQTVTESIHHTANCETETLTVLPTPSCSTEFLASTPGCAAETVTITPSDVYQTVTQSSCAFSSCTCSPTVTSVLVSPPTYTCSPTVTSVLVSPSCSSVESASSVSVTTTSSVISDNTSSLNAFQLAEEISQNLTIDAKKTSAYQRKLISAMDGRYSSKVMGYLGICFVSIPLGLILLLDVRKLFFDFVGSRVPVDTDSESE